MASLPTLANGHLGINSDQVVDIALVAHDAGGAIVPMPGAETFTVTTTGTHAASLAATIGTMPGGTAPSVHLVPMVAESDAANGGGGIGLALTDSAGLPIDSPTMAVLFDITVDQSPVSEGLDLTDVSIASQPVPTASGP